MRIEYGLTTLSLVLVTTAAFKFNERARDEGPNPPEKNASKQNTLSNALSDALSSQVSGAIEWVSVAPTVAEKTRGLSSDQIPKVDADTLSRLLGELDDYDLTVFRERNRRAKEKKFIEGHFGEPLVRRETASSPDLRAELNIQARGDSAKSYDERLSLYNKIFKGLSAENKLASEFEVEFHGTSMRVYLDLSLIRACQFNEDRENPCDIHGGGLHVDFYVNGEQYRTWSSLESLRLQGGGYWLPIDLSGCGPIVSRRMVFLAVRLPASPDEALQAQILDRQKKKWISKSGSPWQALSENLVEIRPQISSQNIYHCSSF